MLTHRWEFVAQYGSEYASNPVNETAPAVVNNAGVQLTMNAAWAGLGYWFFEHDGLHIGLEGLAGYPTYAHATVISGPYTQFDAQFSPMAQALAEAEIVLGRHFSINVEGGYQYALLGALSQGGGTTGNLKQANGNNVNLDMSGWKIRAGLGFHF
jgi:hypothetical protein